MKSVRGFCIALLLVLLCCCAGAEELRPSLINITTGRSVGDGSYINVTDGSAYPFLMTFTLDEKNFPAQSCRLGVYSWDCDWDSTYHDYEYDMVYVNDTFVGVLTGCDDEWKTSYIDVPLSVLKMGENTITIYVGEKIIATGEVIRDSTGWLLEVQWASIQLDGGKSENAPEVFTLELTDASETETGITCTAQASIVTQVEHSYIIEYSLINMTPGTAGYGNIVSSDQEYVSGTNIVSNGHFHLAEGAARGAYRIEATLRDSITNTIYAYASYDFNMEETLTGGCQHVSIVPPEFIRTNYYRLAKDHLQHTTHHEESETWASVCWHCNATYYTYTAKELVEHATPVCPCGYVEEGFNSILSATLKPMGNSVAGEDFFIEVITHKSVTRLSAENDVGTPLNETWTILEQGEQKIWRRIYRADVPARNRVWTVKSYNSNGHLLNVAQTNALEILPAGQTNYLPLTAELQTTHSFMENPFETSANAYIQFDYSVSVWGGSGSYTCAWGITNPQGERTSFGNTEATGTASLPFVGDRYLLDVTVNDLVTGEAAIATLDYHISCTHPNKEPNGETSSEIWYKINASDHLTHTAYIDYFDHWVCTNCFEEGKTRSRTDFFVKDVKHMYTDGVCVCGSMQVNFSSASRDRIVQMINDSWDKGGLMKERYDHWTGPLASPLVYVADRVVALDFSQMAADACGALWNIGQAGESLLYDGVNASQKIFWTVIGEEAKDLPHDMMIEQLRVHIANDVNTLYAGLTTDQLQLMAGIVTQSVDHSYEFALAQFESDLKAINGYLKRADTAQDIAKESIELANGFIDFMSNRYDIYSVKKCTTTEEALEWLLAQANYIKTYGAKFDKATYNAKFPEILASHKGAAKKVGKFTSEIMDSLKIISDSLVTISYESMVHTFRDEHLNFLYTAYESLDNYDPHLRTTLRTLIDRTETALDEGWVENTCQVLTSTISSATETAIDVAGDILLTAAAETVPGLGVACIAMTTADIFLGQKTDDVILFTHAYEMALDMKQQAADYASNLSNPSRKELDELYSMVTFYMGMAETARDAFNQLNKYNEGPTRSARINYNLVNELDLYLNIFNVD